MDCLRELYFLLFLQKVVAEINNAHISLARQVNTATMITYWNIGKLLFEEKLDGG